MQTALFFMFAALSAPAAANNEPQWVLFGSSAEENMWVDVNNIEAANGTFQFRFKRADIGAKAGAYSINTAGMDCDRRRWRDYGYSLFENGQRVDGGSYLSGWIELPESNFIPDLFRLVCQSRPQSSR